MAEIRSRIMQVATHPGSVTTRLQDGVVTLAGPVFDHEVTKLIDAVRKVKGVTEVRHSFDVMRSGRGASRARENQFGYQPEFIVGRWAFWVRVAIGACGMGLLGQGLRKKGRLRGVSVLTGLALLTRAVTNHDITRLIGSLVLPVMRMRRTVEIAAPVDDVFEFWRDFSNYSKFMSFIRSVEVNDTGTIRWTAIAPGGIRIAWDTTVLDLQANQRIAWKSVPGSVIAMQAGIEMQATELDGTLLRVELTYAPPFGALGYALARLLGFDPGNRIDEDLEVMRRLIEVEPEARSVASIRPR